MIDFVALLSSVTALLVGIIAWVFVTFRAETRETLHKLNDDLAPIKTDIAVIKARQEERKEIHSFIDALRSPPVRLPPPE